MFERYLCTDLQQTSAEHLLDINNKSQWESMSKKYDILAKCDFYTGDEGWVECAVMEYLWRCTWSGTNGMSEK